ncbi:MAG: 2-succinyl-6-hydroxy-2,4-cyclohexadiene-1-carboxylate synthase [Ignavibacteriaceae bacterium]|jgi:2-succinyl-6-hydroxy-2,4-cyclohexadiene-1-carboxylate synthase|nr:2-succinyl-6-hydroxy-2,4-cyclohexadiene-1-carboxylate synthase [Ignavibacteriaceae bacterium]
MLHSINGISIFIKKNFRKFNPDRQSVLFLHGFGGSSNDWDEIISLLGSEFQLIAIDLPGFGKSSKPRTDKFYQTDFLVQLIDEILCELKLVEVVLAGYSMGGRLALKFAHKHPRKVKALILESSSPGIKTKSERQLRIKSDAELISFINKNSLKDFFTFWQNLPLFASQKNLPIKKQRSILLNKINADSKIGLTNSLKNFGQGEMENLWNKLSEIKIPTLLLTGALDTKYSAIQLAMNKLLPNSSHKIIGDAGHNLHLEKPEVFVNLVREFLQTLK